MRYPCLVNKRTCTTLIKITADQEGVDKYGEPLPAYETEVMCNYQDGAKTVWTAEKKLIQLTGAALIPGDVIPELPVISSGTVTVHGVERQIHQGSKARNPDGTVNYTKIEVM